MQNPRSEARVLARREKKWEISGHYSGIWENTETPEKSQK